MVLYNVLRRTSPSCFEDLKTDCEFFMSKKVKLTEIYWKKIRKSSYAHEKVIRIYAGEKMCPEKNLLSCRTY